MSDELNENLISSPAASKLSNSNSVNKMYTPCRRVGLKRKSTSSPCHSSISKKTNLFGCGGNEDMIINKNLILSIGKAKNKTVLKINSNEDVIQSRIKDRQNKIEELKSELKNSQQHNLDKIKELSTKWLQICQAALMSLLNKLNQEKNSSPYTLKDLITNLGIDQDLIQFDSNNQEFY